MPNAFDISPVSYLDSIMNGMYDSRGVSETETDSSSADVRFHSGEWLLITMYMHRQLVPIIVDLE